jgi:hypothetical protein
MTRILTILVLVRILEIRFCFEHNFGLGVAEWHANNWSLHKFRKLCVKRRKSVKCLIKQFCIVPSYRRNWLYFSLLSVFTFTSCS